MLRYTSGLVASVASGRLDGVPGLAAYAAVPAVAAVELACRGGSAVAEAVRRQTGELAGRAGRGLSWLRVRSAAALRSLAQVLDPVREADVATPIPRADEDGPPVSEWIALSPESLRAVPMPSAARETEEEAPPVEAPAVVVSHVPVADMAAALAHHGSVKAAAKALGIAESTFRGRCRKAGVQLPGRKAKG